MAHPPSIFAVMITHYCLTQEDALKQAKRAGKEPGCYYGGITLPNGKRGFAVYKNGKLVERYLFFNVPTLAIQGLFFLAYYTSSMK